MSGMDRLTDEALITGWDKLKDNLPPDGHDAAEALFDYGDKLADALSRRASQAAPAPSDHAISKEWAERMLPLDEGVTPSAGAPAPSDALTARLDAEWAKGFERGASWDFSEPWPLDDPDRIRALRRAAPTEGEA